ncbi:hypothetical protein HSBAA_09530 [Vreelandella sulfidaeris]|uniref:Histone deacetylase domain-containing protein n=1 Tax=Vreelandella sulfidaeris TaxID=115553 RepID=A0A455U1Y2_9GAMM|nr:hypothetical protein HSBAA_09530 [Halomonas sulfidaeris]
MAPQRPTHCAARRATMPGRSAPGLCLLNNSALAATVLRERYGKVAIIDVDLHHGNGTQDIFLLS